jgi:anti-anti-sigma factor
MKFFASPLDRFRRHSKPGDDTSDRIGVVKVEHSQANDSDLPVTVSQQQDKTVVSIGAIALHDLSEVRDLGAWLIQLLEDEAPKVLVVDLGQVKCLTSESLNQLINVNCHARERGTKLVLANLCRPLLDVFHITRLDRLFEVAEAE